MDASPILHRLASAWRGRVGTASRQALLALLLLALFAGAHLARLGTPAARGAAAGALVLVLLAMVLRSIRWRRDWLDLERTLTRVVTPSHPELGERALRAARLMTRTRARPDLGSEELARLHFERTLARIPLDAVTDSAEGRARRYRLVTLGLVLSALTALVLGPLSVLEGVNVLLAWRGRAPVPMPWLDAVELTAQPPSYLRSSDRRLLPGLLSRLPEGTLLTVRGKPLFEGRALVLSDGRGEVPFTSDGAGGVVARWTLQESTELFVAARFGSVLILEGEVLPFVAEPDGSPSVTVEDAPRTVELADVGRVEIRYEAEDDHGLRQVDLVLRAGDREERRVLLRLDGTSRNERGGHALSPRDEFLRRMFLPVVVTVEARDDDPINGPKWGSSEPITLIPSAVGKPESDRYRALAAARDSLVDYANWRVHEKAAVPAEKRVKEDKLRLERALGEMRSAVDEVYAGAGVPNGLRSFLLGQMRVLERPLRAGESAERRTDDVLLGVDAALRGLGTRDARGVSKRLADVAEEAASGARQARETEKRSVGMARLDSAIEALDAGGVHLSHLGLLGADLGGVLAADLGRVRRLRDADDLFRAELAARHLAQRLARPNPSFGSAAQGGVEAGAPGMNATSGSASEAAQRFDQLAGELEELAESHASEIERVQGALSDAERAVELGPIEEEAKRRAQALREALADLPQSGDEPGSARASAALAREHTGSMAQSLERLRLDEAVQSGKDALSALEEAERRAKAPKSPADWLDGQSLADAKRKIREQQAWAEKQLERLRAEAERRASDALRQSGQRESELARRAGNLASRGKSGETALPADALEALERAEQLMRDASRALAEGKGDRALELQRQAQRLLEQSDRGRTTDDETARADRKDGEGARELRTGGEVPDKKANESAEAFRRRVLRGLSERKDDKLAPAVRRYAEGLLQ